LREVERDREDSERVSRTIVVRQPSRDLARDCSSSKSPGLRPTQELICGFQTRRLSLWVGRDFRKLEKSVAPPFAGLTTDRSSGLYSWLPQQISTRIPLTHTLANSISLRFLTICMHTGLQLGLLLLLKQQEEIRSLAALKLPRKWKQQNAVPPDISMALTVSKAHLHHLLFCC
jgi:hypothetical protein